MSILEILASILGILFFLIAPLALLSICGFIVGIKKRRHAKSGEERVRAKKIVSRSVDGLILVASLLVVYFIVIYYARETFEALQNV